MLHDLLNSLYDSERNTPSADIDPDCIVFAHFFDPRRDVPAAWGGLGVPLTYYLTPDGEVFELHNGILDEQSLVEGIEDLLAAS